MSSPHDQILHQAEREKEVAVKFAKQQANEQIKKIATERDQAHKKLKEAEAREAEIRKQALEQAEKKQQKELLDQRASLEKRQGYAPTQAAERAQP